MPGPFTDRNAFAPFPPDEDDAAPEPCPRCGGALADPEGLAFCAGCGYCRSLEEDRAVAALVAPPPAPERPGPSALGASEFFRFLGMAPTWIWVLTCAALAVVPLDFVADRRLPPDSAGRAYWGLGQLGVGLVLLVAGQGWALSMLRARKEHFPLGDMLWPFRLWVQAGRWLPETRWPFAVGASGLTAVLAAGFWIGGFGYWLRADPRGDAEVLARQERERSKEQERLQLKKEVARAQKKPDPPPPPPPQPTPVPGEDTRPATQCVILGYVPAPGGGVGALVLGTLRDGRLTYAGRVQKGIRAEDSAAILKRLAGLGRDTPLLADLKSPARWVRPELFCEVRASGVSDNGLLIAPSFKGLVDD